MAGVCYWPQGATGPPLRFAWTYGGAPFDLSAWSVTFLFGPDGEEAQFERSVTHDADDPAANGQGRYEWQAGDLSNAGTYWGQLSADDGAGEIRKSQQFRITVLDSLSEP